MSDIPQIIDVTSESWIKLDEFGGGMLLGNEIGQLTYIRLNGDPSKVLHVSREMSASIALWDMSKEPPKETMTELYKFVFKDTKTHDIFARRVGWNGTFGRWLIQDQIIKENET